MSAASGAHDSPREVTGGGRGHGNVRATHGKSLELVREPEIGSGATCVVAVGARLDEQALASLRGWVELRIESGGAADTLRARLNPAFLPGDPLIVRPATAATRDALLIEADKTAADLDRDLVEALASEGEVRLSVREVVDDRPAPGALIVDPGVEWGGRAGTDAPDGEGVVAALDRGERVLLAVQLACDPQAAALVAAAADAGHVVLPAPGLAPVAAALAVAGVDGSRTVVAPLDAPEARPSAWTGACVVVPHAPLEAIQRWLAAFDPTSGARGAVGVDVGTRRERWLPWRAGQGLVVPGGGQRPAVAAVGGAPGRQPARPELPPAVELLGRELARRGASTRELARALERATGIARNAAYEAALGLTKRAEQPPPGG